MKGFTLVMAILCTLAAIAAGIVLGIAGYQIDRDILSWLVRAEVSSDPEDVLLYMERVKSGMEAWEMTDGHAALIFKTPRNDMGLIYEAVQDHVRNAQLVVTMDPSSTQYQSGLDRLQDSIGILEIPAHYYWGIHGGLVFWVLLILFIVLALVFWIWLVILV